MTVVAVGLVGTALLLGPERGAMGLMGAMAANAGRDDPMPKRIWTLVVVGLTTLACQAIGLSIAPYPWLVPPVMTAITVVIMWAWHALHTGPPGPINTIFAGAFGTYMGTNGWSVETLIPVTALAWLLGALASVAILAIRPHVPGLQAVDAAEGAISAYARQLRIPDDDQDVTTLRLRAWLACDDAWNVLRGGRRPDVPTRTETGRALEARLTALHQTLAMAMDADAHFPGRPAGLEPVSTSPAAPTSFSLVPLGRPDLGYLLRTAFLRGSRPRLLAGRAALSVLLAASTMFFSPVGHPYWAILSALIVVHMTTGRADLTVRAAHRVVGTGVGVGVYFLIVLFNPGEWLRLGIVVAAIYGLELMALTNYAIATTCVTVFALLMTPVTSSAQIGILIRDRFVETVIGVGMALLVTWFVGWRAPVLLVRRQHRLLLERLVDVLRDLGQGVDPATVSAAWDRRNLVFEIGRANSILAAAEPDARAELDRWWALQKELVNFGFDVMTASWTPPVDRLAARRAGLALRDLVLALPPISSRNIDVVDVAGRIREIHRDFDATA